MNYDPERDPGRTHEEVPQVAPSPAPETLLQMGSRARAMTQHDLVISPQQIGGGMSLQATIAQIAALQRAIQDQTRLINDFLRSNADTTQLVRTELTGSRKGYDQQMLAALTQSEASLNSSLSGLQQASAALDRVQLI